MDWGNLSEVLTMLGTWATVGVAGWGIWMAKGASDAWRARLAVNGAQRDASTCSDQLGAAVLPSRNGRAVTGSAGDMNIS